MFSDHHCCCASTEKTEIIYTVVTSFDVAQFNNRLENIVIMSGTVCESSLLGICFQEVDGRETLSEFNILFIVHYS